MKFLIKNMKPQIYVVTEKIIIWSLDPYFYTKTINSYKTNA